MAARRRSTQNAERRRGERTPAEQILDEEGASLLDLVDNALNKGVVLSGDVTLALAQVDLVYARLSLLLCAADRVLPNEDPDFFERHRARKQRGRIAQAIGSPRPLWTVRTD